MFYNIIYSVLNQINFYIIYLDLKLYYVMMTSWEFIDRVNQPPIIKRSTGNTIQKHANDILKNKSLIKLFQDREF